MSEPIIYEPETISDFATAPDLVTRELGDMVEIMSYQLNRLTDATYDHGLTPPRKVAGRILRDRIGDTFQSLIKLIEKIESRPMRLDRARRVLAVADEAWICRELIRELAKLRVQDREFDAELDGIYREARTRLAVLESGDLEAEQQETL